MKIYNINTTQRISNTSFAAKHKVTAPCKQLETDTVYFQSQNKVSEREKFSRINKEFSAELGKVNMCEAAAYWNFYTNATAENQANLKKKAELALEIYKDKDIYEKLKSIDINALSQREQKQLTTLLRQFKEGLYYSEEKLKLSEKQNKILQKYDSFVPILNGKEVGYNKINKILATDKNPELRRKAYATLMQDGDAIAEDLRNLVHARNDFARKMGFSDYYTYTLKSTYNVDVKELNVFLDNVYKTMKPLMKKVSNKRDEKLKQIFDVEKLEAHHYKLSTNLYSREEEKKEFRSRDAIVLESKKIFRRMGYDINKMLKDGRLKFDLFPREGKIDHGFCITFKYGEDANIFLNLSKTIEDLKGLNHELGHAVYHLNVSKDLPFLEKVPDYAINEAIAFLMEDFVQTTSTSYEDQVENMMYWMTLNDFEQEMYKNPNQDLKKLWKEKQVKYKYRSEDIAPDNSWARVTHLLTHPAYVQNYIRATIMMPQIKKALEKELGNIQENPNTAEYLKENLFKYGRSISENELIKKLTGKELSAEDYAESLNS